MLEVKNVVKSFDGFNANNGLTFTVPTGSVYGLIGPNGAGKTTIIKQLAGIYRQDSGDIFLDGETVYENHRAKDRIVYIPDDLYFFMNYSIAAMANFYSRIYPRWSWDRFLTLAKVFKTDPKRRLRRLSKGMQKQAAFWMGMCAMPDMMILDEPIDGLDPVMRKNVWSIIMQDVAERDTTVLISSHNLRELEDVCDHVGIMHEGRIVLEKSLDDVKGNIHKVQLAFRNGFPEEIEKSLNIIHREGFGSVHTLIVRDEEEHIKDTAAQYGSVICDILPLTLEEVFIYELGGIGYETENILL